MLKPQRNQQRELVSLDGYWSFRTDPDGQGEQLGWHRTFAASAFLAVPGSWNEQQTDLESYFGPGWYATEFDAPEQWKGRSVVLHVGNAQNHARVWLNGVPVGGHRGGCLPFALDLSDALLCGERNRLTIEVDGSLNPWDLPAARIEAAAAEGFHNSNPAITYDFFPFCGIARSVHLEITPTAARIQTLVTDYVLDLETRSADLTVSILTSGATDARATVLLESAKGNAPLEADGQAEVRLAISNVRLWDVGRPELYRLTVLLEGPNGVIDRYEQSIGFRKVEATADHLLLNGRPLFLKGFGKHEDFPITGRSMPPAVIVRDFDLLNWTGANSFRTSHYPYSGDWYEQADRLGVLVIGESPLVGLCQRLFEAPDVLRRALDVVGDMIARDRHHPSVIMWSVANEPWIESPEGEVFINRLLDHARTLDPSRPVTYVAHMDPARNAPLAHCDVVCVNKYCGWYELPGDIVGGTRVLGGVLDDFRKAFGKPVLIAEFGADAVAGMHSLPAVMFSEEFQAEIIEAQYREARRRPWVIGTHVWAFADFKTPQSITRVVRNHKGLFTRDRSPKLAAHALRRLWHETDTPALP